MYRIRSAFVPVVSAIVCGSVAIRSQAPQFSTGVNLIRLDVSVLDKNNQPVRGLTAADFTIREDKQPKPIQTFLEVKLPEPQAATGTWQHDVSPDVVTNTGIEEERLMVIVIDDLIVGDAMSARSLREIGQTAINALGPTDIAAVSFMGRSRFSQEFTHDRSRLLSSINRFQATGTGVSLGTLSASGWAQYVAALFSLRDTILTLGTLPERRKAVLWLTSGFYNEPGSRQEYAWKQMLRAAQLSNVNIYVIDPTGLQAPDPSGRSGNYLGMVASIQANHDMLLSTASNTGGHTFLDSNEFKSKVPQIFRETGSFYLLGYANPPLQADGKFHRLEVKLNRPGVTVHARDGYYDPPPPDPRHPSAPPVAIASLLPKRDLALSITAAAFKGEAVTHPVVAVLGVTPSSTRTDAASADVIVEAWLPADGLRKATVRSTVSIPTSASSREAVVRLDLPPGRYQLRASANSSTLRKSGSVYADLDVPDFTQEPLSASGVVIGLSQAAMSTALDPLQGLLPVVPTSSRTFGAADQVMSVLRISQGGAQPPSAVAIRSRILDDKNSAVSDVSNTLVPDMFRDNRTASFQMPLPLASLRRGSYLLSIEAVMGKATLKRDVIFTRR